MLSSSGAHKSLSEFFCHHRIWAPGVRLFRNIGFRSKALVIAATFMLPMALVAWNFFVGQAAQIEFSAKERLGVAYAREAAPLLDRLQRLRLYATQEAVAGVAPVELAAARQAADSQLAKLAAVEKSLAAANAKVAERGGQIIGQVVSTMQQINTSSGRIGDTIGTIDSIAFQTNILALNAAVEAARAIKALITTSMEQVDGGTRVVRDAGTTIDEIVGTSRHMRELLTEVASGAREQTLGIAQSAKAVQELDTVTQQNAALGEQTAAAAGSLKDQAHGLAGEVAQFKLPGR